MKPKLYLKFVLGPQMGLLHGSSGYPTADIDSTVAQVVRALNEVGLHPDRSAMRLRLRSFGKGLPFADGIFSDGRGSFGMLLYGPSALRPGEIDAFLLHNFNLVPFFRAHTGGSTDLLFTETVLPAYPELPTPVMVMWPAEDPIPAVEHCQSSHPQ